MRSEKIDKIDSGTEIAVGVPVLHRTEALRRCLESIDETVVDRVIVADNGRTSERAELYDREWGFELTVLDLDYNVGTGPCRAAIADELTEDYLIVGDNDMIFPDGADLRKLQTILEARPGIGVAGGILVEGSRVRSGCTNLHEEDLLFGNKAIVHSIRSEPDIEWIDGGIPIARFDKLANAAMMKRECIESYSWDPDFPLNAHLDFYIGHYQRTDWEFAVCPNVVFDHQKGRYERYRREVRQDGEDYNQKRTRANELIKSKWGYDRIEIGRRPTWVDTKTTPVEEGIYRLLQRNVPIKYILPFKDLSGLILAR